MKENDEKTQYDNQHPPIFLSWVSKDLSQSTPSMDLEALLKKRTKAAHAIIRSIFTGRLLLAFSTIPPLSRRLPPRSNEFL